MNQSSLTNIAEFEESLTFLKTYLHNPLAVIETYYKEKEWKVRDLILSESTLSTLSQNLDPAIKNAVLNLKNKLDKSNDALIKLLSTSFVYEELEFIPRPISHIGVYVPHRFVTSLITWVSAAKAAGVEQITAYLAQDPITGQVCPASVAAGMAYGVQILSGPARYGFPVLAFGYGKSQPVDMLCGPSSRRLNVLKQACSVISGKRFDFVAGPSELAIILDAAEQLDEAIIDLNAQIEHGPDSKGYLIIVGNALRDIIEQSTLTDQIQVVVTNTLEEACEIVNRLAPETVEVITASKSIETAKCALKHYGVLYFNTSSSLGDYLAVGRGCGDPTQQAARSQGGISPFIFLRFQANVQSVDVDKELWNKACLLAQYEKLDRHLKAVKTAHGCRQNTLKRELQN